MGKTTLVIMAAGIGSRYGGGIKQMESFGPSGEIMMDYSVFDALEAGFEKVVFIIRKDMDEDFRRIIGDRIAIMKDGEIQQIDNPTNLFNYPVNKFVAGFIGTPTMNFFDATCLEEGGKVVLRTAGGDIDMNDEKAAKLREGGYIGKKIVGGVRPEHVTLAEEGGPAVFEGEVNVFELLGSNAIVYVQVGGEMVVMNTNQVTRYEHGDKIRLGVVTDKVHVFDPETERTVTN